jgi:hypothetical protein
MIEAVIERATPAQPGRTGQGVPYGVGRVTPGTGAIDGLVLAKLERPDQVRVTLDETRLVVVPGSIDAPTALQAPSLALALWMWDQLKLELGDVALVSGDDAFAALIAQAAVWRGGCPVIRVSAAGAPPAAGAIDVMSIADPEVTARDLRARIAGKPGFAAVELTGRASAIDVLFEIMPRWGRMMLAGGARETLTIDFYNNVHRKGMLLLTGVVEPARALDESWGPAYLRAAFRFLTSSEHAAACASLFPAPR